MKKMGSCRKDIIFSIVAIFLIFALIGGTIFLLVDFHKLKNSNCTIMDEISNLKTEVSNIKKYYKENKTESSEYEKMIAYLESEMNNHRKFIEDERQFLIWLMATIGAVSILILGFVGLSNKKEIEETVNKTIENFSKDAFEKKLGNLLEENLNNEYPNAKIGYLKDAVEKQKKIRETNIVIFRQEEQNSAVLRDCKQLFNKQCHVIEHPADMITDAGDNLDIKTLLPDGKSIVVYEVHQKEYCKNKPGSDDAKKINNDNKSPSNVDDTTITDEEVRGDTTPKQSEQSYEYVKISKNCSEHNIYCILYAGAGTINPISDTYTAMSKTGVSLYQYLNTLISI